MSFLSPALFAVLIPLAALPLVLHLLNKGFPRHFRFPSIELIRQTMARRSKVHRWRHWILLLLRTVFLLLLLLAFLAAGAETFRRQSRRPERAPGFDRAWIIRSAWKHKGDGPTSRERAVHEAVETDRFARRRMTR